MKLSETVTKAGRKLNHSVHYSVHVEVTHKPNRCTRHHDLRDHYAELALHNVVVWRGVREQLKEDT